MKSNEHDPKLNEAWQLLLQVRKTFVAELPARIERMESQIIALREPGDFKHQFADLVRDTHSLKGSGGTYGLPFITSVCHNLEDAFLVVDARQERLSEIEMAHFLEYIDIMKDAIETLELSNDFSGLEKRLHSLKQKRINGFSALLLSASRSLSQLCRSVANEGPTVEWRVMEDGYDALGVLFQECFDLIVMSNELERMTGEAVIAALRLSNGVNRHTPIILVSSSQSLHLPREIGPNYLVKRDSGFVDSLSHALTGVIKQLVA